ncbi:hypothetical protein F5141DRAFT_76558 [Pisolithus sp. B1]|nr:hypothetical protein F5141DRAFT_76558 [Pisolithus sp. B1]
MRNRGMSELKADFAWISQSKSTAKSTFKSTGNPPSKSGLNNPNESWVFCGLIVLSKSALLISHKPSRYAIEEALFIQLSSARGYLSIMSIERRPTSQFPPLFDEVYASDGVAKLSSERLVLEVMPCTSHASMGCNIPLKPGMHPSKDIVIKNANLMVALGWGVRMIYILQRGALKDRLGIMGAIEHHERHSRGQLAWQRAR